MSATLSTSIMPEKELSGLQTLPLELQLNIAEYLDYGSLLALRRTNRHLHNLADRIKCSDREKSTFVHAAEQYPRHAKNFGCYRCYRVLPASEFADRQIRRAYGKGNVKSFNRFCFQCGVEKRIFCPGNRVLKDGVDMICCRECRRVREVQFCSRCWRCSSCLPPSVSATGNGTGNASDTKDSVDTMMSPLGLSSRTALENAAFSICTHDTIEGKVPKPKRWYDDSDEVQALGMAFSMAELEADYGGVANPEWFEGGDF